ncbi:glycosyltransferase [Alcaligenes aquatilis]|uniref:glycosyltransferase n=1 Tax=Alcaligenes aquatilis TaxID=323284 RepID=UPI003F8F0A0C
MSVGVDSPAAALSVTGDVVVKPRKMAFVVDIRGWAFDTIARSMQARLAPLMDACEIIYWEDFDDPNALVTHVNGQELDLVHFFFREHLDLILKTAAGQSDAFFAFCRHAFTTHIPDYLYSSSHELAARATLFDFVDGYFTTCQDLFDVYACDPLIRDPDGVIFDWPDVAAPTTFPTKSGGGGLRVLWSGNSKWGEYAGFVDYKGLDSVIRPALKQVQARSSDVEFVCFDSAEQKVSHETILSELERADVLLIASEKEGTPLTLIEAMSRGCAVVTTPVGIAPDVLPEIQQQLICARNADSFAQALISLCEQTELLNCIQQSNWQTYQEAFGPGSPLLGKWAQFLNSAYARHQERGLARKQAIAKAATGSAVRRLVVTALRSGVRVAKRFGLVERLNRLSPHFAGFYNRVLHGGIQQGAPDYERIGLSYQKLLQDWPADKPLVVYAPMWKGVAASTESLFGGQALRFPYFDSEFPEVESHSYLDKLAALLADKLRVPLVYSGGSVLHLALAQRLHQLNPQIRQFFMWHGSPAQWVDKGQAAHFQMWHTAYRNGTIQGMVTVKPGLHLALERIGIRAWDIFNPVPDLPVSRQQSQGGDSTVQIGLFSAISSWYKNPYVQLLAVAGRPDVVLNTNLHEDDVRHMDLGIKAIRHYHHMPRPNFLQLIAQQDLNLYVTNTECSPMTALESWALGVPCIVGPAGDVYSAVSERLGELLVEPKVDNPTAIAARIDLVLAHRDEIVSLLSQHRANYNALFRQKMDGLLQELCNA